MWADAVTPTQIGRKEQGIELMHDGTEGTMVCGLDVHHASPGSNKSSYAALVATLDPKCVVFRTVVTEQVMVQSMQATSGKPTDNKRLQRQEIVSSLEGSMVSLLHSACSSSVASVP